MLLHLINAGHILYLHSRISSAALSRAVLAIKDGFAGLIHLNFSDDAVGGVNTTVNGLTIDLISSASLDVDDILLTIAGDDLTLLSLELSSHDHDLVILADRQRANLFIPIRQIKKT